MTTNCNQCGKAVPEIKVREAIRKRGRDKSRRHHNIYCDKVCYDAHHRVPKTECVQCGEITRIRGGIWEGREICNGCRGACLTRTWANHEIVYLATINPGVGLHYFVKMLWPQSKQVSNYKYKLIDFFGALEEFEKVDYLSWLENPKLMRRVRQDEVPKELQWAIDGNRRSTPSNHLRNKRRRAGLEISDHVFVKIPPEFKWGNLEELSKKFLEE